MSDTEAGQLSAGYRREAAWARALNEMHELKRRRAKSLRLMAGLQFIARFIVQASYEMCRCQGASELVFSSIVEHFRSSGDFETITFV